MSTDQDVTLGEVYRLVKDMDQRVTSAISSFVTLDLYEAHRTAQGERLGALETGFTRLDAKLEAEVDKLTVRIETDREKAGIREEAKTVRRTSGLLYPIASGSFILLLGFVAGLVGAHL